MQFEVENMENIDEDNQSTIDVHMKANINNQEINEQDSDDQRASHVPSSGQDSMMTFDNNNQPQRMTKIEINDKLQDPNNRIYNKKTEKQEE